MDIMTLSSIFSPFQIETPLQALLQPSAKEILEAVRAIFLQVRTSTSVIHLVTLSKPYNRRCWYFVSLVALNGITILA